MLNNKTLETDRLTDANEKKTPICLRHQIKMAKNRTSLIHF